MRYFKEHFVISREYIIIFGYTFEFSQAYIPMYLLQNPV
jgi:hypothetical protein